MPRIKCALKPALLLLLLLFVAFFKGGHTSEDTTAFALGHCSPNPCENGGTCVPNPSTPPYYTCNCTDTGFIGPDCGSCVKLNPYYIYTAGNPSPGTVVLTIQPAGVTKVYIYSDCVSLDRCVFEFTPEDWDTPQPFTASPIIFRTDGGGSNPFSIVCAVTALVSSTDLCDGNKAESQALVYNPAFVPSTPRHFGCSTGDPHFTTFDGRTHHFYDIGDFYLARDLEGDFAVQVRQTLCSGASCNTAIAVKFRSSVVYLSILNGVHVPSFVGDVIGNGVSITGSEDFYEVNLPNGVSITVKSWLFSSTILDICVVLPESMLFRVAGLAGFFTNDPSDDFTLPSGLVTNDEELFHQSWRVPLNEDLFVSPFVTLPEIYNHFPSNPNPVPSLLPSCTNPQVPVFSGPETSPLGNLPVPFNPNYSPPSCETSNMTLMNHAEELCGDYFNSSKANCCKKLGVDADGPYTSCVCDFIFSGGADYVLSSINLFNTFCVQAELLHRTTCNPCPSSCSGHGVCGELGVCSCFGGFQGADCSENWSNPPELFLATESKGLGCPRMVTLTGNFFFGTDLNCIFDTSEMVNATKISNFLLTCPIPRAMIPGITEVSVIVERSDGKFSNELTFNFTSSCCDSLCLHGICSNGGPDGFICNCTNSGYHGELCETSSCPAESYDHASWPESDPGTYVTGICDLGFSGTPSRFCGTDGNWTSLVVSVCERNTCPSEVAFGAQWPTEDSLTTALGTCLHGSTGRITRFCQADGTWGDVSGECSILQCPQDVYEEATWPVTNAGQTAMGSCLDNYSGSPSRECLLDGTWNMTLSPPFCERNYCQAVNEGGALWPETESSTNVTGICIKGNGTEVRTCDSSGTWLPILGACIVSHCPPQSYDHVSWPRALGGGYSPGSCDIGYTGNPYRYCDPLGSWSQLVQYVCQRIQCQTVTEDGAIWPGSYALTTVFGQCLPGTYGTITRVCGANGGWGFITGTCIPTVPCPSDYFHDAYWPQTDGGTFANGICSSGFSGSPQRFCGPDGNWTSSVNPFCQRNTCPPITEDGATWGLSLSLTEVQGTCFPGTNGVISRPCGATGVWGDISGSCIPNTDCPANVFNNAQWPITIGGTYANGVCVLGYSGLPHRYCNPDGTWLSLVVSLCQRNQCEPVIEAGANWTLTNSLTIANGFCLPGTVGTITRPCDANGNWGSITGACLIPGYCPPQFFNRANWPETAPGQWGIGTCIPGWFGNPVRKCKTTGVWEDLVQNLCQRA